MGSPVIITLANGPIDCLLKDISAGGAAVDIEVPVPVGELVTLNLSTTRSIDARIVRVNQRGSGLEFLVDDDVKQELTEYIINGLDPADW